MDDVATCWQDNGKQWCPSNFDNQFHGKTTLRSALGNSLNIPAVKTLEYVSLPSAVDLAAKMGITTWGPDSGKTLGLSLTLGGAEIRPIDMAQVYATFANNGRKVPLVSIRQVVDASGKVLADYAVPPGEQVLDPRAAYLISNVLSDPTAKLFTYGRNTPLILKDHPAASKTGTTDNYRDTWTDGYTTSLAIVVWVGNTDGHPMKQALSSLTAGKIWPEAMQASFEALNLPAEEFPRPAGLVEQQVCGDTAMRPGNRRAARTWASRGRCLRPRRQPVERPRRLPAATAPPEATAPPGAEAPAPTAPAQRRPTPAQRRPRPRPAPNARRAAAPAAPVPPSRAPPPRRQPPRRRHRQRHVPSEASRPPAPPKARHVPRPPAISPRTCLQASTLRMDAGGSLERVCRRAGLKVVGT